MTLSTPEAAAVIRKLTKAQRDALGRSMCPQMFGGVSRKMGDKLVAKGLIEARERTLPGWPPLTVTDYVMPIAVNMAYCAWCSEHASDEE